VVETSPHALSVRYGGSGKLSAREGSVYQFSQRIHAESSTSQRGLHTLTWHLMAQLLPSQEPCAVKVASDKEYLSEFGLRDTKPWRTEDTFVRRIFLSI
jgi:hypothetical protein